MNFLPLPDKVYKYRSAESAIELLIEQTIYLPSVSKFNDPFDCKIPMNFVEMADDEQLQRLFIEKFLIHEDTPLDKRIEKVETILADGKIKNKETLHKMEESRISQMEKVFGVFCTSVISDNLLMWSHYGDSHRGICIGFNPMKLIDVINPTWVAPVSYSFDYPKISILEHPEQILEIMLFNKSVDWLYEKEMRFVKNTTQGGCKLTIPTEVIEEVYLGCMTTRETESQILQITADKYPQVRVVKYKKNKLTFKLENE